MKNYNKGITLIALVITIIVLLILAAISIATLTGDNGILAKASKAKVENAHAEVKEALRLKYANYVLEKKQGEVTGNLIEYLQKEKIIGDPEEDGKYKIDVEKLLNKKSTFGNGTDGKDVYMLEEVTDELNTGTLGRIASTKSIKLVATTSDSTGKKYKIKYYGKIASEDEEIEVLVDTIEESKPKEIISFTIKHAYGCSTSDTSYFIVRYQCEKGMTWREFVESKYNSKEYIEIIEDTEYSQSSDWEPFSFYGSGIVDGPCSGTYFGLHEINSADEEIKENGQYEDIGLAECVYPNSNILVSKEGKTIQAMDIKEGNDIAYYNFETEKVEIGKVQNVYIHKQATNFVRYKFEDGSYLEATDYHPIYTNEGWKSYTRRNGYEVPKIGDEVKTEKGWKRLVSIESFEGLEDCYDFVVIGENGKKVNNYYANGTLVQGSY